MPIAGRRLYFFPTVHCTDLTADTFNPNVIECWKRIKRKLEDLPCPDKVYMEAWLSSERMPEKGKPLKIPKEDRHRMPPEVRVLGWLGDRCPAAQVVPVESTELYTQYQRLVEDFPSRSGSGSSVMCKQKTREYDDLIRRRDEHIGPRIGETLLNGKTGVLFLGAYHNQGGSLVRQLESYGVEVIERNVLG